MNTNDLQAFTEQDEPQLVQLVLTTARDHRRLPTGDELAKACRQILTTSA